MSSSIYSNSDDNTSKIVANNITVAKAYSNRLILAKTVYPDREVAYDNVRYYTFFNRPVQHLQELFELVKYLLARPQCCVIRGVCIDDAKPKQRRLLYDDRVTGEHATVIEQDQNWFALDVDGYGESSGDLKCDANNVLLALGLSNVEAFAIPSAGYLRKPGIHIRLFLWNSVRVTCLALKKHFKSCGSVVDTALFGVVQPIYIARPRFIGLRDPCNRWWSWIAGDRQFTDIPKIYVDISNRPEDKYTKQQASHFLKRYIEEVFDVDKDRHNWLINRSIALGKWIWQDILDEEEVVEELYLATAVWRGDRRKDMQTIVDGIKRGKQAMENRNEF
jgi:hypothetical protein